MKWSNRGARLIAVAVTALGACVSCRRNEPERVEPSPPAAGPPSVSLAQDTNAPIANVRIPLDHWPDGTVKTQVVAAKAKMENEDTVDASMIRIETYDPRGDIENLIMAQDCHYDRRAGRAVSDGAVHFERPGLFITGKGFVWNESGERIKILRDAKVVLQRNIEWGQAASVLRRREEKGGE